jgi:hypothetical protein
MEIYHIISPMHSTNFCMIVLMHGFGHLQVKVTLAPCWSSGITYQYGSDSTLAVFTYECPD